MIVGGAIVLWVLAVAITCAVCVAAARADRTAGPPEGREAPTPDPIAGPQPVTPELLT